MLMVSHPAQILIQYGLVRRSLNQRIKEIPLAKELNEPTERMTHPLEVLFKTPAATTTLRIERKEALDFVPAQPLCSTPTALS